MHFTVCTAVKQIWITLNLHQINASNYITSKTVNKIHYRAEEKRLQTLRYLLKKRMTVWFTVSVAPPG